MSSGFVKLKNGFMEKDKSLPIAGRKHKHMLQAAMALLVGVLIMASSAQVFARSSGLGIRAGMNLNSLPRTEELRLDGIGDLMALSDEYSTGYHLGLVGHWSGSMIYIQPELLYVWSRRELELNYLKKLLQSDRESDYYFETFNHLSLPLVGGLKLGPFRLGAGPVFSLLLSSGGLDELDLRHDYKDATVGLQLHAGLKLGSLLLDLKYESSLAEYGDGISIGGGTEFSFDHRPRQFMVSLGLLIF